MKQEVKTTSIRLPAKLVTDLEKARKKSGRNQHAEILARIEESFAGSRTDAAVFGWQAPEACQTLGKLLGIAAGWVSEIVGTEAEAISATEYATLRRVLGHVFDHIGATDEILTDKQRINADGIGAKFVKDMQKAAIVSANDLVRQGATNLAAIAECVHALKLERKGLSS